MSPKRYKEKGIEVEQVWVKLPSVSPFGDSKVTMLSGSKCPQRKLLGCT